MPRDYRKNGFVLLLQFLWLICLIDLLIVKLISVFIVKLLVDHLRHKKNNTVIILCLLQKTEAANSCVCAVVYIRRYTDHLLRPDGNYALPLIGGGIKR